MHKYFVMLKISMNVSFPYSTVVQEVVYSGGANILTSVLKVRDLQRHIKQVSHIPQLMQHYQETPEFYVERK